MKHEYLLPPSASNWVTGIDSLYWALVALSTLLAVGIFVAIFILAVKYRRTPERQNGVMVIESKYLEIIWSVIPFFIGLAIFAWGAIVYLDTRVAPVGALEISVVGKQWMWKVQHPEGRREINELHMPVGRPVVLRMISQDVIHSFFIPAFRIKQDVLPQRYTSMWFTSDKVGTYHLFCAEYCGKDHSEMIGSVHVMTQDAYEQWLMQDRNVPLSQIAGGGLPLGGAPLSVSVATAGAPSAQTASTKPEDIGRALYASLACVSCHGPTNLAPKFEGVYGTTVELVSGKKVKVDENYIRESILNPGSKIVKGYNNLMPSFAGRVSEEDILNLIAYIKSLAKARERLMSNVNATPSYLGGEYTIKSWLLTRDHKRIAMLYLVSVSFFFAVGGLAALVFRIELTQPKGFFLESDTYNRLFSLHGIVMVFLFLIPAIPAILGNFLIPIMIGTRDLAFPKINLLSWYVYMLGGLFILYAIIGGGVDTGWTFYTPYSSTYANTQVVAAGMGAFIVGFSSIFTALNFIVTVHTMRAPGMTWFRLPLFVWGHYATSLVIVLGTPVIAITVALMAVERAFGVGVFDPNLGGDPVLFQHLFWFYSHPAVYIMVLPAMAVINELIPAFSRRRIYGYNFIAYATLAIAAFGFLVWGHHLFISGQSPYAGLIFSFISFLIAVPSGIKIFNWIATLYKGSVSLESPMLYALGFIGLFTIGGLTGLFLAAVAIDLHVHDTYFVVAHFHYVMVGGTIMAYLGGIHFWWPKMTGKMYPEGWAKLAAGIVFIGFNLTFFPQFIAGWMGMPRRYHLYPEEFQLLHVLSTAGATILATGYLLPAIYLPWSLFKGENAPANPWGAKGLEWETASPPPTENFEKQPIVTEEAYAYHEVFHGHGKLSPS